MEESKFEFRELCGDDVFPMFTIIGKIGFNEFKNCFENINISEGEANFEKIGLSVFMDIAGIILKNLPDCRNEIYALLASVSNMNKEQIAKMPLADFAEMIIEFVRKPEFMDFFKVVSKLFKSEM